MSELSQSQMLKIAIKCDVNKLASLARSGSNLNIFYNKIYPTTLFMSYITQQFSFIRKTIGVDRCTPLEDHIKHKMRSHAKEVLNDVDVLIEHGMDINFKSEICEIYRVYPRSCSLWGRIIVEGLIERGLEIPTQPYESRVTVLENIGIWGCVDDIEWLASRGYVLNVVRYHNEREFETIIQETETIVKNRRLIVKQWLNMIVKKFHIYDDLINIISIMSEGVVV